MPQFNDKEYAALLCVLEAALQDPSIPLTSLKPFSKTALRQALRKIRDAAEERELCQRALIFWVDSEKTVPASDGGVTAARMQRVLRRMDLV